MVLVWIDYMISLNFRWGLFPSSQRDPAARHTLDCSGIAQHSHFSGLFCFSFTQRCKFKTQEMAYKTLYFKAEEWNGSVLEQWNGEENEIESIKRKTKKNELGKRRGQRNRTIGNEEGEGEGEGERKTAWLFSYSVTLLKASIQLFVFSKNSLQMTIVY
jgi:hypothetical protein